MRSSAPCSRDPRGRVRWEDLPDAVPLAEAQEDRAGLDDHEAVVLEHRDLVVRFQRQERGLHLLVPAEIDGAHLVAQAELLEGDRRLAAVRRLPGVEPDHARAFTPRGTRVSRPIS